MKSETFLGLLYLRLGGKSSVRISSSWKFLPILNLLVVPRLMSILIRLIASTHGVQNSYARSADNGSVDSSYSENEQRIRPTVKMNVQHIHLQTMEEVSSASPIL